ncbi:hypothetical protein P7C70_g1993, partial [Phenoliferia sp. Uapishka_3]
MGKNPPRSSNWHSNPSLDNKRDKAQLAWEDRLLARRGERETEDLQLTVERLEKEVATLRSKEREQVGEKVATVEKDAKRIEGLKTKISSLEHSLSMSEEAAVSATSELATTKRDLAAALKESRPASVANKEAAEAKACLREVESCLDATRGNARQTLAENKRLNEEVQKLREENANVYLHTESVNSNEITLHLLQLKKSLADAEAKQKEAEKELVGKNAELGRIKRNGLSESDKANQQEHKIDATNKENALSSLGSLSSSNPTLVIPRLVQTIQTLNAEISELRGENISLLLQMAGVD